MHTTRFWIPALVLALLAGCGGGSSASTSGTTSGSSTTSSGSSSGSGTSTSTGSGSTTSGTGATSGSGSGSTSGSGSSSGSSSGSTTTTSLSIKVSGGNLVDGNGKTVQLRGVNVAELGFVAVQGWDAADPWGGSKPSWSAIKAWGANAVRLPLNEASWLGLQCAKDPTALSSTLENADPGGNYKQTVQQAVTEANAAGLVVILDLHWSAPDRNGVAVCPMTQNVMASADHAPAFWSSVAAAFKANPAVLFELFNEPFVGEWSTTGSTSTALRIRDGGTATGFMYGYTASDGTWKGGTDTTLTWAFAGMQALLDAVRATGATNVVLVGSDSWSQQVADAVASLPTDALGQLAVAWHPYPIYDYGTPQVRCVNLPGCSSTAMAAATAAVAAGHPVVATEYGDTITSTSGADSPWAGILLPFADQAGIGYLGWTWDAWSGFTENVLIRDATGTPTYGYGEYVKQHYLCRAAGTC